MGSTGFHSHQSSKRSSQRHHRHSSKRKPETITPSIVLHWITEICLLATVLVTLIVFGGRTTAGLLALSVMTGLTLLSWSIRCLVKPQAWVWSGLELPAILTVSMALVQTALLPEQTVQSLMPALSSLIPYWSDALGEPSAKWTSISLVPHETVLCLCGVVCVFSLILIAIQVYQQRQSRLRATLFLACLPLLWSTIALLQLFLGNGNFLWIFSHPYVSAGELTRASFTNPNHLAGFAAMGIAPLIGLYFRKWSRKSSGSSSKEFQSQYEIGTKLILMILGMCLLCGAVALSDSRGGMLLLAVTGLFSLVIAVVTKSISKEQFLVPFLILVSGGVVGLLSNETTLERTATQFVTSESEEIVDSLGRKQIWQANVDGLKSFFTTGVGLGTHQFSHHPFHHSYNHGREFTHAENGYLQFAFEMGVSGILIMGLGALIILFHCYSSLRRSAHRSEQLICISGCGVLFCMSVHSFYDYVFYVPVFGLMTGFWFAIIVGIGNSSKPEVSTAHDVSGLSRFSLPGWNPVFAFGMLTAVLWSAQVLPAAVKAESRYWDYLALTHQPHAIDEFTTPQQQQSQKMQYEQERMSALMEAFLANPQHPVYSKTLAYLMFSTVDKRISRDELRVPLSQIRDVVMSGSFESLEQSRQWLNQPAVLGNELRLLKQAQKVARYSLKSSPLVSESYIVLSELRLLDEFGPRSEDNDPYLHQAQLLNPASPHTEYLLGQRLISRGDHESAFQHWQRAITCSAEFRNKILTHLAPLIDVETLITEFEFDLTGLHKAFLFYQVNGTADQQLVVLNAFIQKVQQQLPEFSLANRQSIQLFLIQNLTNLKQFEQADQFAMLALQESPNHIGLRRAYGLLLYQEQRYAEALEHLNWCLQRKQDAALERAVVQVRNQLDQMATTPQWDDTFRR